MSRTPDASLTLRHHLLTVESAIAQGEIARSQRLLDESAIRPLLIGETETVEETIRLCAHAARVLESPLTPATRSALDLMGQALTLWESSTPAKASRATRAMRRAERSTGPDTSTGTRRAT
jgi:hypothetical protein